MAVRQIFGYIFFLFSFGLGTGDWTGLDGRNIAEKKKEARKKTFKRNGLVGWFGLGYFLAF